MMSSYMPDGAQGQGCGADVQRLSSDQSRGPASIQGRGRCVRDTGAGIASTHLPRIFERFYRADTARSREERGTGLGLAIAKHMVEGHGGTVQAESLLGAGTTIRFTLPRRTARCRSEISRWSGTRTMNSEPCSSLRRRLAQSVPELLARRVRAGPNPLPNG